MLTRSAAKRRRVLQEAVLSKPSISDRLPLSIIELILTFSTPAELARHRQLSKTFRADIDLHDGLLPDRFSYIHGHIKLPAYDCAERLFLYRYGHHRVTSVVAYCNEEDGDFKLHEAFPHVHSIDLDVQINSSGAYLKDHWFGNPGLPDPVPWQSIVLFGYGGRLDFLVELLIAHNRHGSLKKLHLEETNVGNVPAHDLLTMLGTESRLEHLRLEQFSARLDMLAHIWVKCTRLRACGLAGVTLLDSEAGSTVKRMSDWFALRPSGMTELDLDFIDIDEAEIEDAVDGHSYLALHAIAEKAEFQVLCIRGGTWTEPIRFSSEDLCALMAASRNDLKQIVVPSLLDNGKTLPRLLVPEHCPKLELLEDTDLAESACYTITVPPADVDNALTWQDNHKVFDSDQLFKWPISSTFSMEYLKKIRGQGLRVENVCDAQLAPCLAQLATQRPHLTVLELTGSTSEASLTLTVKMSSYTFQSLQALYLGELTSLVLNAGSLRTWLDGMPKLSKFTVSKRHELEASVHIGYRIGALDALEVLIEHPSLVKLRIRGFLSNSLKNAEADCRKIEDRTYESDKGVLMLELHAQAAYTDRLQEDWIDHGFVHVLSSAQRLSRPEHPAAQYLTTHCAPSLINMPTCVHWIVNLAA